MTSPAFAQTSCPWARYSPTTRNSVKADTAIDCCGQQFSKWNESPSAKWSLFTPPSFAPSFLFRLFLAAFHLFLSLSLHQPVVVHSRWHSHETFSLDLESCLKSRNIPSPCDVKKDVRSTYKHQFLFCCVLSSLSSHRRQLLIQQNVDRR